MAVIQRITALAIGETNDNAIAGSTFEFARTNQLVSIGVVSDVSDVFVTINSGVDIVLEESEAAIKATFPVIPDEMYYNDVAAQGDRLVIKLRNANAAAAEVRLIAQVTPLR